jgi:tetratricopeptide (TPR) repeat protein
MKLARSFACLALALAGCAGQRAAKWDERGEAYLHSGVDLHVPPIAEASLAGMAAHDFDWQEYWRPAPGELPNKYGRAAHAFSRAVSLQPDVPRFHVHLGVAFLALRQPERAEESFRRALALDPGDADAGRGLAAAEAAVRARPRPGARVLAGRP